ncbi:MAG: OmpA family protein [Candidatus Eisenbacteria bacterium]|nr:OmpA family protein [Candidatus Eisenbacteria bacterium]
MAGKRIGVYCLVLILAAGLGCSGKKELLLQKDQEITRLQDRVATLEEKALAEKTRADDLEQNLRGALKDLEETEQVCMQEKEGCQRITLTDAATFGSGSATLSKNGRSIIDRIWNVLDEYPDRYILIEGHTDNVPIAPKFRDRYASNWELSTSRALSVLQYILSKGKADPTRLAVVGYGEERPVASNDTAEGRAQNRRVVIAVRDFME